jgi:hypothetical protein
MLRLMLSPHSRSPGFLFFGNGGGEMSYEGGEIDLRKVDIRPAKPTMIKSWAGGD